jgi:isoleucyl-tRNA synthetase
VAEVGDVWLDAGIVPFSTLGWQSPAWIEGGYATGASRGLSGADLPDHAYWEEWFPADWVSEMREQIRLWFYSLMFMSVALTGEPPYRQVLTYEKLLDAEGREMHGSWGNLIEAEEAFERMGADVMRWLYCEQPPTQNIRFGFGPAEEVKRRLLTLWNSVKFLVDYGNIAGFRPHLEDLAGGPADVELQPLDRWIVARTAQLVADATKAYDGFRTVDVIRSFEAFVDDLSNWYIRRSRRRFWDGDEVALRTLWHAVVQGVRVISPVMPFLSDHLWRNLAVGAEPSVFLAGWPEERERDDALLREIAEVRRVVELGRQARAQSRLKLRQPLRRLVVEGAQLSDEHLAEVRDELRVKEVELGPVEATELRVKPNLPLLGPKLGKELGPLRAALEAGQFDELEGGRFRVGERELEPDEVLVERTGKEGWAVASAEGVTVALDTELDPELELEALVLDLIHVINAMRKEQGLELTDRIRITLPASQRELLRHEDWIKQETLAVEIEVDGPIAEPQIAKA